MDNTSWTQLQPNPNPVTDPNAQIPCPNQSHYYPQPLNPNPTVDQQHWFHEPHQGSTVIPPPGVDSYNYVGEYTVIHDYTYQQTASGSLAVSSSYYQDPNGLLAKEAVSVAQSFVDPYNSGLAMAAYPINLQKRCQWKKAPKKAKVVQSAWCAICNIECNTKDVLELHRMGKKHKKNLEKLKGAAAPTSAPGPSPAPASTPAPGPSMALAASQVPIIGPQENPNKTSTTGGQKKRKKAGETPEDLEMKRKKVLEGGAAAEAVRACSVCNVVCNSDTVFRYHLAGQKHAAMMKRRALATGIAAAL